MAVIFTLVFYLQAKLEPILLDSTLMLEKRGSGLHWAHPFSQYSVVISIVPTCHDGRPAKLDDPLRDFFDDESRLWRYFGRVVSRQSSLVQKLFGWKKCQNVNRCSQWHLKDFGFSVTKWKGLLLSIGTIFEARSSTNFIKMRSTKTFLL